VIRHNILDGFEVDHLRQMIEKNYNDRLVARDGQEHSVLLYCQHCQQLVPQVTLDMDDKSLFWLLEKHHANCDRAIAKGMGIR